VRLAKVGNEKWAATAVISTQARRAISVIPVSLRHCHVLPFGIAAILLVVATTACAPTVDDRGDLPAPEKVALIHAGSTTRDQVVKILGTPSSTGIFDDRSWYYISRKTKQVSFWKPEVLDQQVYVVNFDPAGVVRSVDHKTLKDGRDIAMAPGATPAPGRELTFIEQVLGNIGRFNSASDESPHTGGPGSTTKPDNPNDK
jgi:outer membrane protein assembly factor BamE (lipoprotein component of BamABCDE complex)